MTANGTIQIELIEHRLGIPLTAQQWNGLAALNDTHTVFQTFEWFDAWWRSFGEEHELFFLLLRADAGIVGFAPLMIRRIRLGVKQLEFVGTGNADYLDFVLPADKAGAMAAVCRFLSAHAHRWTRAWLSNLPADSATARLLAQSAESAGLHLVEEAQVRCPVLALASDPSAARRLIDKYSVRRKLNWFTRRGDVRFRHVQSLQEINGLLPQFFDQHVRRWAAVGRGSLFEDSRQRRFYMTLAETMQPSGWLLFSVVELNGEPVAFHFGFDFEGSVVWYKPTFEIRYARHSPGLLLIRQLIEDSLERGRREVDFTIGEESFKERFSNAQRWNLYVGVYHDRIRFSLATLEGRSRRAAGRLLRVSRSAIAALLAPLQKLRMKQQ